MGGEGEENKIAERKVESQEKEERKVEEKEKAEENKKAEVDKQAGEKRNAEEMKKAASQDRQSDCKFQSCFSLPRNEEGTFRWAPVKTMDAGGSKEVVNDRFILRSNPGATTGKKVPPFTPLAVLKNGEFGRKGTKKDHPWSFASNARKVMVYPSQKGGVQPAVDMETYVQTRSVKWLNKHGPLEDGKLPEKVSSLEGDWFFLAKDEVEREMLRAAKETEELSIHWAVTVTKEGVCSPTGLVIANNKQKILKSGGLDLVLA